MPGRLVAGREVSRSPHSAPVRQEDSGGCPPLGVSAAQVPGEPRRRRAAPAGCSGEACPAALSRFARARCSSASACSARACRACSAAAICASSPARSPAWSRAASASCPAAPRRQRPASRASACSTAARASTASASARARRRQNADPGRAGSGGPAAPRSCRASSCRRRNAVSAVCGCPVTGSGSPQYPGSAPASPGRGSFSQPGYAHLRKPCLVLTTGRLHSPLTSTA